MSSITKVLENPSLTIELLIWLDDEDLFNMCMVNKNMVRVGQIKELWNQKLRDTYPNWVIDLIQTHVPIAIHPKRVYLELGELYSSTDRFEYATTKDSLYLFEFLTDLTPCTGDSSMAIRNNSVMGLKWLIDRGVKITLFDFIYANKQRNLEIVEFLYPMFPGYSSVLIIELIYDNNIPMLNWWAEPPRNKLPSSAYYYDALRHEEICDWMISKNILPRQEDINVFSTGGISMLEKAEKRGWIPNSEGANMASHMLPGVPFDTLDWLAERGILPDARVFHKLKMYLGYVDETEEIMAVYRWLSDHNIFDE